MLAAFGSSRLKSASGWEHVQPANDPFILAANHSSRLEALFLPAWLAMHRGGRQVHFLADWNFLMWPLAGSLIRMNDPIIVSRKPARPRFLNAFKPLLAPAEPPFKQARRRLLTGSSVGIFPEGTVNPSDQSLLRGYSGVARLSLETGAAIIPVGIRITGKPTRLLTPESMEVRIGRPLRPVMDYVGSPAPAAAVRCWHENTMRAIADLSGKTWQPHNPRSKYAPADSSTAN